MTLLKSDPPHTSDRPAAPADVGAQINDTNAKLSALEVGLSAWLVDPQDRLSQEGRLAWQLGYAKYEDTWQLCVRKVDLADVSDAKSAFRVSGDARPLTAARRAIQTEAVAKFEKLFEVLADKADGFASDIQAVLSAVKKP
jgi:hypothetical protein